MPPTPDDVDSVTFNKGGILRSGYDETQVDEFLELITRALCGEAVLTPAQVREVRFGKPPRGRRGYNAAEVDAFLALVEAELRRR